MMFSDDEIKEIREGSFMRPGDEIISIREVCLNDKFDKKDLASHSDTLLSTSKYEIDRSIFRDGFFSDGIDQPQASFAWTEEDGNIASMVSEPGFGTTGQTTFGKDLDAVLKCEMKEADTSSAVFQPTSASRNGVSFDRKPYADTQTVSSTSTSTENFITKGQGPCKVDKTDPRSRLHYVKYVKRHGRTIKLWECSICSREFQHQYTLMRHLPTHTDERNFHCDVCGKSFRQLSTLSQHRAIHSTDRPYSCEVCNKTFNRVSTLISHRKTHSEEKPYKCHICPKGFHQKGNLRNHLFTHTNERPYRCSICFKGFNQQSNLVCHKNKAHNDDSSNIRVKNTSLINRPSTNHLPNSTRSSTDCEVSSTVPYFPSAENSSLAWHRPNGDSSYSKSYSESGDIWSYDGSSVTGVIVDSIKTYHMGVALATKQTPFALLKPDDGCPVLVKVVDTKLRGGKQMLVPATAEDLRIGGKIVMKNDDENEQNQGFKMTNGVLGSAVQIRVPVVATVVPRIRAGGRLQLCVEEPHHAYHTALSSYVGEVDQNTVKGEPRDSPTSEISRPEPILVRSGKSSLIDRNSAPGPSVSTSCTLPPPAPSPPLDLMSLDLFDEPMECIPMGPQITAVDNIDRPPNSDDSDIFIGEFEV